MDGWLCAWVSSEWPSSAVSHTSFCVTPLLWWEFQTGMRLTCSHAQKAASTFSRTFCWGTLWISIGRGKCNPAELPGPLLLSYPTAEVFSFCSGYLLTWKNLLRWLWVCQRLSHDCQTPSCHRAMSTGSLATRVVDGVVWPWKLAGERSMNTSVPCHIYLTHTSIPIIYKIFSDTYYHAESCTF